MQKKLTITLDEEVYRGLYEVVGRRRISQFIERLVRPHVTRGHALRCALQDPELAALYHDLGEEDLALAESGLAEYQQMLNSADTA